MDAYIYIYTHSHTHIGLLCIQLFAIKVNTAQAILMLSIRVIGACEI